MKFSDPGTLTNQDDSWNVSRTVGEMITAHLGPTQGVLALPLCRLDQFLQILPEDLLQFQGRWGYNLTTV